MIRIFVLVEVQCESELLPFQVGHCSPGPSKNMALCWGPKFCGLLYINQPPHCSTKPVSRVRHSPFSDHPTHSQHIFKMRFTSIIVSAALSLAAGSHAWTQATNGVWVANNNVYLIGSSKWPRPRQRDMMKLSKVN